MEVDFTVLESELPLIKVGDKVEVTPYASAAGVRQGSISEINPLVDENGMVRVKARVNGGNKLFDGMNVRVMLFLFKRQIKILYLNKTHFPSSFFVKFSFLGIYTIQYK
jgi:multidrug efflux pump subunit AcrA (membrane-fusion protein)